MKIATTLVAAVLFCSAGLAAQEKPLRIENDRLILEWSNSAGLHPGLSLSAKSQSKKPNNLIFQNAPFGSVDSSARIINVTRKPFGRGKAIEISDPDGGQHWVMLYPSSPFVFVQSSLCNHDDNFLVTNRVESLRVALDLPASVWKTFGTGGLLEAAKNPGSYAWLGVVEPQSRNGVVFGWLTHDRGSGVFFTSATNAHIEVEARLDYGRLRIAPHKTEALETLAIGYFDDARLGLEAWADSVARLYNVHLPPQPTGYCTWYSQPHGGASDEKHLAEQAAFAATNLAPFGFSVVQIDDKWQAGVSTNGPKRNFTTHAEKGPYPSGMKSAADEIKSQGLVPGIWFMPFAGTYYDPFFAEHQDWFVKRADGLPYETAWGGTCLDMTQPGAREHLRSEVHRITHDWGFEYLKVDGLWTGTATKQQYVNSSYKEDGMGDAVFSNPDKTNLEAYRDGLKLLREAAGKKIFILGCNGPQNMRSFGGAFGLLDGMRIGPDNGSDWKSLLRGPIFGSRQYFLHGRVWYNDPDPVYVRTKMPINEAQLICSWVAVSGQLNLSSEWFPSLPSERLEILKRTMPSHGLLPRPVDLFENDPPRIWLLTDSKKSAQRNIIGLFNWDSEEREINSSLECIGLEANAEYDVFDFWQNTLLPPIRGDVRIKVPAQSCRILAVRARADHPQVISTSRHVTQGIIDVLDERWDKRTRTLSGRSKVIGSDRYELRVALPHGTALRADSFKISTRIDGLKAWLDSNSNDRGVDRLVIESPRDAEVAWSIQFHNHE